MQNILHYRIINTIGEGGMGFVYAAVDTRNNNMVAVKLLRPEFASIPEYRKRFEREVRILNELKHPHILPIYDFGIAGNQIYFVSPFMQGGSVHDYIASRRTLTLGQIDKIVHQVGSALSLAHQRGVFHRDIKPANIFLDQAFNAYLADFGIATEIDSSRTQLTRHSQLAYMGTPGYMAPELGMEGPSPRSDIFSLGNTVYTMLTSTVLQKIILSDVDPWGNLPREIAQVLQTATQYSPARRHTSIAAFVADFEAAVQSLSQSRQFTLHGQDIPPSINSKIAKTPVLQTPTIARKPQTQVQRPLTPVQIPQTQVQRPPTPVQIPQTRSSSLTGQSVLLLIAMLIIFIIMGIFIISLFPDNTNSITSFLTPTRATISIKTVEVISTSRPSDLNATATHAFETAITRSVAETQRAATQQAAWSATATAADVAFDIGDVLYVINDNAGVYATASSTNHVYIVPKGERVSIISPPTGISLPYRLNGINWWRISSNYGGIGWMKESNLGKSPPPSHSAITPSNQHITVTIYQLTGQTPLYESPNVLGSKLLNSKNLLLGQQFVIVAVQGRWIKIEVYDSGRPTGILGWVKSDVVPTDAIAYTPTPTAPAVIANAAFDIGDVLYVINENTGVYTTSNNPNPAYYVPKGRTVEVVLTTRGELQPYWSNGNNWWHVSSNYGGIGWMKEIDLSKSPPVQTQSNLYELGITAYNRSDMNTALKYFDQAIQQNPFDSRVYNSRGLIYLETGQTNNAQKDFISATEINPQFAEAYVNLAHTYYLLNNLETAKSYYSQAISLDPTLIEAYNGRGSVYNVQGRFSLAIRDFSAALNLNANYTPALEGLAYAQASNP